MVCFNTYMHTTVGSIYYYSLIFFTLIQLQSKYERTHEAQIVFFIAKLGAFSIGHVFKSYIC